MRPVIIGEAPRLAATAPVSPLFPFPECSIGAKLWRMTGTSRSDYLDIFHRINLWPVPAGGGALTNLQWAAHNLIGSEFLDGKAVLLLGERLWLAFGGKASTDPLKWYAPSTPLFRPACVAWIPIPTEEELWYGDENQAGAAVNFMRLLALGDHPDWSKEE